MDNFNGLSEFVINERKKMKLKQSELAEQIGISRAALSQVELGYAPGMTVSKKLESFFDISFNDMIGQNKVNDIKKLETTYKLIVSFLECGFIDDPNQIKDNIKDMIFDVLKKEIELIKIDIKKGN